MSTCFCIDGDSAGSFCILLLCPVKPLLGSECARGGCGADSNMFLAYGDFSHAGFTLVCLFNLITS